MSRTREFDADLAAAQLTGDPAGLASALAKIEQVSRGWRGWLLPGQGNRAFLAAYPSGHERIARLAELAAHPPSLPPWQADTFGFQAPLRAPRWRAPAGCGADPFPFREISCPTLTTLRHRTVSCAGGSSSPRRWPPLCFCGNSCPPSKPGSRRGGRSAVVARGDLAADEKATIELFENARDSVVYISTTQRVRDFWTRNVFGAARHRLRLRLG